MLQQIIPERAPLAHRPAIPAPQRVWEAGHFYRAKGPTVWSKAGWDVLKQHAPSTDARMLFEDDVHTLEDVSNWERSLDTVHFDPDPEPTHVVMESAALESAHIALSKLVALPRSRRARKYQGMWICSGLPLTNRDGQALCLLYDLGLTWLKRDMGYSHAVNILPHFYENEQRRLLRLVRKAMPDFDLRVILHDTAGNSREIFHSDV